MTRIHGSTADVPLAAWTAALGLLALSACSNGSAGAPSPAADGGATDGSALEAGAGDGTVIDAPATAGTAGTAGTARRRTPSRSIRAAAAGRTERSRRLGHRGAGARRCRRLRHDRLRGRLHHHRHDRHERHGRLGLQVVLVLRRKRATLVRPHDGDGCSVANGNTGGGTNASPHGGILTVSGPGEPNDALVTVPGGALNNAQAVLPAEGQGCWAHAYFEAYIQFRTDGNSSTDAATGWPAFWSWSVQGLKNFGFGGSSLTTAAYSEIDFMETYGTIFGDKPGDWTATMHQWPANASSDGHTQHTDEQWHTYGCLWTSTGSGTGQVKFYFDGAQVDQTVDSGTGQTQFSLEGMYQFIVLGSGKGWDMNVDWVRVWQ